MSPEYVNGTWRLNAPPLFCPFALLNHDVAWLLNDMVKLLPFSCPFPAGENVMFALDRSLGVELAMISTVKPVELMLMIRAEVTVGAMRATVIVVLGAGLGMVIVWVCPFTTWLIPVTLTVIVPATLPT